MTRRLEILKNSLEKKEQLFDSKLDDHFKTVAQANGQPLNDKRNGSSTTALWDRQNDSLRNLKAGIEKTKLAIEREESKIADVNAVKATLPKAILDLIDSGKITQWRKFPNRFFVVGVERARIVFDEKSKTVSPQYHTEIPNQEQYSIFRDVFNPLSRNLRDTN